jgi:hypothetical protein
MEDGTKYKNYDYSQYFFSTHTSYYCRSITQIAFLKYAVVLVQIAYLEQWPTLERENSISLLGATEALKASTLRLPVTLGAKVC